MAVPRLGPLRALSLLAASALSLAPATVAHADDVKDKLIIGGLHYEHDGRWVGLRPFGMVAAGSYLTFDMQVAPWFYEEPELPKGWWARNLEVHATYPVFQTGNIGGSFGFGTGVTELAHTEPRAQDEAEDEKAGFFGPELGLGFDNPVVSVTAGLVAHMTKDAKIRKGVDVHTVIPLGGIVTLYSTIGWQTLEINGEDVAGFSVLVGLAPAFLYSR